MTELEALTIKAQTKRETQEHYVSTVFAALDEGFSPAEIARAANTSRQAIAQLAKRHGKTFPSMRKGVAWGVERDAEEVQRAQRITTNARNRGRLIPEPCEVCGENRGSAPRRLRKAARGSLALPLAPSAASPERG